MGIKFLRFEAAAELSEFAPFYFRPSLVKHTSHFFTGGLFSF